MGTGGELDAKGFKVETRVSSFTATPQHTRDMHY